MSCFDGKRRQELTVTKIDNILHTHQHQNIGVLGKEPVMKGPLGLLN